MADLKRAQSSATYFASVRTARKLFRKSLETNLHLDDVLLLTKDQKKQRTRIEGAHPAVEERETYPRPPVPSYCIYYRWVENHFGSVQLGSG